MKTLEIILALSFVFLILSLLATVILELISSTLSLRGRMLIKALAQMLEIPRGRQSKFFKWTLKEDCKNYEKLMQGRQLLRNRLPSYLTHNQLISILHDLLNKEHFYLYSEDKFRAQRDKKNWRRIIAFIRSRIAAFIRNVNLKYELSRKKKEEKRLKKNLDEVKKELEGEVGKNKEERDNGSDEQGIKVLNDVTQKKKNLEDKLKVIKEELVKIKEDIDESKPQGGGEGLLVDEADENEHQTILFPNRINDNRLRHALIQLRQDAESYNNPKVHVSPTSLKQAEREIVRTYDELMERSTGWYKRQVQVILVCIGLLIAFLFDADTFKVYHKIISDPSAREQVIGLAERYVDNQNDNRVTLPQEAINSTDSLQQRLSRILKEDLEDLRSPLGLGWEGLPDYEPLTEEATFWGGIVHRYYHIKYTVHIASQQITTKKIIGFVCTALAISLGASFWFDILKLLINIRNAGRRPESRKDQIQKDIVRVVVPANKGLGGIDDEVIG